MRWAAHPWKRHLPKKRQKALPLIDGNRVMGGDLERAEAVRERMIELEIEQEARRELQRRQDASNAQHFFGSDRFHAAPPDMPPPPPRLSSKRRQIAEAYLQRMSKRWGWGPWSEWRTVTRPDGFSYQERERARA